MTIESSRSRDEVAKDLQAKSPAPRGGQRHPVSATLARQVGITLVALAIFTFFSFSTSNFLVVDNLIDLMRFFAFVAIVGVGMTFLFVAGEFDLSVGSAYGFGTILMAWLIVSRDMSPWVAALLMVLAMSAIGLFNGVVTAYVGIPSFIVTLGMFSLLRGASLVLSGSFPINFSDADSSLFSIFGDSRLLGIPTQILWMLVVVALGAVALRFTVFGYWVYATGGNVKAARASGINTNRVKVACFVLTGALVGFIAVLNCAWLKSASPTTGAGFELQVIGAVIIGGVALQGGEGTTYGTFIGAAILGMLSNGIVLLGINPSWTDVCIGSIIVVAAIFDMLLRRDGWLSKVIGMASMNRFSDRRA